MHTRTLPPPIQRCFVRNIFGTSFNSCVQRGMKLAEPIRFLAALERTSTYVTETPMRCLKLAIAAAAVALLSGAVVAQTTTTTPSASPQTGTQQPPIAGANSFTEAQAQDRIEKAGFTEVKGLKKDDQGIWRGSAMQSGKQVNVALDFQGNVVAN